MKTVVSRLAFVVTLATAACSSAPLTIPTPPVGPDEKVLGEVSGSDVGVMLFQLIPINQNSRFVDAYAEALARAPGATRLVNPTISERWFWAYLLNGYSFTVRGTAVGPK